ncbi:MAG TPA: acylphosphatase [Methanothrix sp.]|nr:acylphosphatase [Methanothrix sp.]
MKLKVTITGPKVHDVDCRFFLTSMAMAGGIRMFEAYNAIGKGGQQVHVFVDGEEESVKAYCDQVQSSCPALAEVSGIAIEGCDRDVMKIGEYAQFYSTVILNKFIQRVEESTSRP